jgi:type IV pilus assembly protein PilW
MNIYSKKSLSGMSLLELLIAIAIGAMLLASAISLLVNNNRISRTQNESSRVQENVRYATHRLINDISMSGYVGCPGNANPIFNKVTGVELTRFNTTTANYIEGFENAAGAWQPSGQATNIVAVAGTDGITVRNLSGRNFAIEEPYQNTSDDPLYFTLGSNIDEGDIISISDCVATTIFRVTATNEMDSDGDGSDELQVLHAIGPDPDGNTRATLGDPDDEDRPYNSPNAGMRTFESNQYYIGTGDRGPGLFRNGTELVEGVSDMQILYGVNTDNANEMGTADSYVNANAVANWDNVVSVKITLTFNIMDRDFTNNAPVPFVYTNTIRIRNNAI